MKLKQKIWDFISNTIGCVFILSLWILTVFVCGGFLNKFGHWAWGY